jgi:hypothetical protein
MTGMTEFAPAEEFSDYPVFCQPVLKEDNPSLVTWIDGWAVYPTGDFEQDKKIGYCFADIAIRFAREKQNAGFVYMVLGAINFKTLNRMIIPGGIEYGSFQRVSQIAYCGSMN